MRNFVIILVLSLFTSSCANQSCCATSSLSPRDQVIATEKAFAKTMADRDKAGFISFVSSEAVFLAKEKPLHGRDEVAAYWQQFFEGAQAPFSWEPETVEVLASGILAISTGPVRNSEGKIVANYTSTWRLENGKWKIIFDKGNAVCN